MSLGSLLPSFGVSLKKLICPKLRNQEKLVFLRGTTVWSRKQAKFYPASEKVSLPSFIYLRNSASVCRKSCLQYRDKTSLTNKMQKLYEGKTLHSFLSLFHFTSLSSEYKPRIHNSATTFQNWQATLIFKTSNALDIQMCYQIASGCNFSAAGCQICVHTIPQLVRRALSRPAKLQTILGTTQA